MAAAAAAADLAAIDLAEQLVRDGVPFRKAHAIVGDLVASSFETGESLMSLARLSGHFGDDVEALFDPVSSVERRVTAGGAGTASASRQSEEIDRALSRLRDGEIS